MSQRREVSPATLPIDIGDDGVTVEYLDGRHVRYPGPIQRVPESVRCAPGKEVHVLVTDGTADRGAMIYVNDRNTHGDILEDTGVGRVLLGSGEESELFPGVGVQLDGHAVVVRAELGVVEGRVFVFEEDDLGERAFELTKG